MKLFTLLSIICSFTCITNVACDINKPSKNFKIGNDFRIWYKYNTNTGYFVAVIECYHPKDWFMIGWGHSENDIDSWVFEIDGKRVLASDRYWGDNMNLPRRDVALGGRGNLQLQGYKVGKDKTTVKVRRKFNTRDKYDKVIRPGDQDIYWAYGSDSCISEKGLEKGSVFRRIFAK